jgi:hypothetical protein
VYLSRPGVRTILGQLGHAYCSVVASWALFGVGSEADGWVLSGTAGSRVVDLSWLGCDGVSSIFVCPFSG